LRAVPRHSELYPNVYLTTEEKAWKTSVRVVDKYHDIPVAVFCPRFRVKFREICFGAETVAFLMLKIRKALIQIGLTGILTAGQVLICTASEKQRVYVSIV
jgi:hypothetical protein